MTVLKVVTGVFLGAIAFVIFIYGMGIFLVTLSVVEEYPISAIFAGQYLILGALLIASGVVMLWLIVRWVRKKERPRYPPPPPTKGDWQIIREVS